MCSRVGVCAPRSPPGITVRMDAAEHDAYGWFTFEEAYAKIKWTDDREALEQFESRLR